MMESWITILAKDLLNKLGENYVVCRQLYYLHEFNLLLKFKPSTNYNLLNVTLIMVSSN